MHINNMKDGREVGMKEIFVCVSSVGKAPYFPVLQTVQPSCGSDDHKQMAVVSPLGMKKRTANDVTNPGCDYL